MKTFGIIGTYEGSKFLLPFQKSVDPEDIELALRFVCKEAPDARPGYADYQLEQPSIRISYFIGYYVEEFLK